MPLPPNPRDSVAVLAVAWPVRLGIESTDSVFGIRWLQRAGRPAITSGPKCPRPVEVDSFPAANRITALYPWQTRPGGDSIFVTQPALGNGQRPLTGEGFTYTVCQLARNAFTSSVIVWSGPVERCGILAAHWQAGTDPIAPAPDPSPEPGFALDTLNPFQTAGGALRPGIMRVDSVDFEPGRVTILRAAGTGSYMVKVDRSGSGAVVYARLRCPNANDTTPDPHWLVRWNPRLFPDSGGPLVLTGAPGDPNLVYPAPVALAMAAQLPVDSIAELTRRSMASFLDADGPTSNSRYWYDRCFGPRDLH
ncbi:MAG TPA: hypothetical protein VE861_03905 [Gemmatimonadaceae bacterium]|nr:hypothetical protein [Gemmatimonadaceae bacterium]